MEKLDIKTTEIIFAKPLKAIIRCYDDCYPENIKENVTSIDVHEGPIGSSLTLYYKTDDGDGSVETPVKYIKEIYIVND